jgi:PST family polysaccharide transporter
MTTRDQVTGARQERAGGGDEFLSTERLKADLGRRTARGGAVTVTSQGLKFVISMAATVVLARLLTPQDYGLVGMVVIVTGFVLLFKDLGLSSATIQKEDLSRQQVDTLFWVNVALSVFITLLTMGLAPLVAWFYGEPRLTAITVVFAVGFLFGGLAVQHEALLRRQMRFTALAVTDFVSLGAGLAVGIPLAWYGAGYWALVVNQLVTGLVYAACVWAACGWRPGPPRRGSGVRPMLAFGSNLTGFTVVNYFARNLDNMLIGRYWGSVQLGLYAKAYQMLLLPIDQINTPITAVAMPALSRLTGEPERYRQAYVRLVEKVAMVTMPLVAYMVVTSDWVVRVVLGPQWGETALIFSILGIAGVVQPVASTTGWLFVSQGRTREMLRWGLIGPPLLILSIVAGLPWGAVGVATSYTAGYVCITTPLLFWYVGRAGHVRASDIYRAVAPMFCTAASVAAALLAFRRWVGPLRPVVGLALCFGIAAGVAFLLFALLPSGRRALRDLSRSLLLLAGRGGGPDAREQAAEVRQACV